MEKMKITNSSQFEKLVDELKKNPSLARGFRRGTVPNDFKEQWERIATALNDLGPPNRTGDGWQKIWRDYKFKVKKKIVTNKIELRETGGGISKQLILSPLEEAVANLLQFQKELNPEGMLQEVPNIKCEPLEIDDSTDFDLLKPLEKERTSASSNEAVTTTYATMSTSSVLKQNPLKRKRSFLPKNSKIPTKRHELLQRHSNDQARLLTEISNSISSIKLSLSDIRDIEEKRFNLELDKNKREEEMYKINLKIKRIELSIKQQELQLLNNEISD